jgi:microsomal dipeptidase-like Zn-dependent dipeptidase
MSSKTGPATLEPAAAAPKARANVPSVIFAAMLICAMLWMFPVATFAAEPGYWEAVVLEDKYGRRARLVEGETGSVEKYALAELARVYVAKGYRATLCDGAGVRAGCRRLAGPTVNVPTIFAPPFTAPGTTVTVEKALFGFADLHVHPATHLAWGARGGQGFLWGRPGMAHDTDSIASDLPACPSIRDPITRLAIHTHSLSTNPIAAAARFGLLEARDSHHGPYGYPWFLNWPSAGSVSHQQMHVTMLRRAFEGGLRLIVASATDNQLLDIIWNPEFSLSQGRFALREDADYKAAAEQFDFIREFVRGNASWMAIVKTPAEARLAIHQNKLAVVLGLEMDELSAEEILKLKEEYGVALVIPVHLVNNSFGGSAVYEPFFNVANYIMNGDMFRIRADETLGFKLDGIPSAYLNYPLAGDIMLGDLLGRLGTRLSEYAATGTAGHRNRVGLLDEHGIRRLMKAGLLIDTAHMSSAATSATLAAAETFGYPVVHSHGGIRCDVRTPCKTNWGKTPSERAMSVAQYQGLANSGGILGLGTGYDDEDPVTINDWLNRYLDVAALGPVALGTDLNGMAEQIPESEYKLTYPTEAIQKADWTGRSNSLDMFQLGNKRFDIQRDGIAHIGMLPDFLAVVRQRAEQRARTREFDQIFHSAHDFIATWEQASQAAPSVNADLPPLAADRITLTIETGTDDLKCGRVMVSAINRVAGQDRIVSLPAMINQGLKTNSTYTMQLQMLAGTELRDIDKIRFEYLPIKCDPFDTGDTWNIKTLKVTYNIIHDGSSVQGVLMHKRGAPAKKLDRGGSWTVYTER